MSDKKQEPPFLPDFTAEAHDRVLAAKSDYLGELPGGRYRETRADIDLIWPLIESPIEQVAILQLAGANYGDEESPRYAKVASERGKFSHWDFPVQIIPQVVFGPYRVDLLLDLGAGGLLAVECDGAEFHTDKARDAARDAYLKQHYRVSVLRIPGKDLWRNNRAIALVADVVRARLL